MTDQNKNLCEDEIIRLVKEAMKSNVSKEEFSLFLKNKAKEKQMD